MTIASGGDGGGSIRIPAGFNGLVGMKGTAGRIPRGPRTLIHPMTVVIGCLARSVRDVCRWFDVTNGFDARDPYSLPRIEGWERDLGSYDLRGKRVAIAPTLGRRDGAGRGAGARGARPARRSPGTPGLELVDVDVDVPDHGREWAMANLAGLKLELGDLWPDCKDDLTVEIAFGLEMATLDDDPRRGGGRRAGPHRGERGDGRPVRPGRLRHRRHEPRRRLPGRGRA